MSITWENTTGTSISTDKIHRIVGGHTSTTPYTIMNCYASTDKASILITDNTGTNPLNITNPGATTDNGADWDEQALPAGIFDNANWEAGTFPMLPKLKQQKVF